MKIYVLSAGLYQEQGYSWQAITQDEQKPIDEPDLVNKVKGLLETQAYSIFIGRESGKLILLVTGMKASKRKDYRGRTIRNSLTLIAEDNGKNEQKIRALAALALEDKLKNKIDSAIRENEQRECGFEISYKTIDNAIKTLLETKSSTPTKPLMIGKNSEHNRKIIAEELQESYLPDEKTNSLEALVVVTGIKTEDALKDAGVWRGLSNLVENEDLYPYDPPNQVKKIFPNFQGNRQKNPKSIITLMFLFGVIGLILWFFSNTIRLGHNNYVPTNTFLAAISPDGQHILTTYSPGKILVQDTENKAKNIIENEVPITSVAISSNGNYVVTGDQTGTVQLWDVTSKKKIDLITNNKNANFKHEKEVLSLGINDSENKIQIVSGGADGQILLWNINIKDGKTKISIDKL